MFEVLAYVFDNYWSCHACPDLPVLQRKLTTVGFDSGEIRHALLWLEDLKSAASCLSTAGTLSVKSGLNQVPVQVSEAQSPPSTMRIFSLSEQNQLGVASWGYIVYLTSIGVLPSERLELVMDRVMATAGGPVSVDDLKLIVLMVYWSLNEELDALVADELCGSKSYQFAN
jgi:Smg protein